MLNDYYINEKMSQENISKIENIIRWLLDSYYRATGIKAIFIDRQGKIVVSSISDVFLCNICKMIQSREEGEKRCLETFHNSALKSIEYGFPYIYQCYAGIIEWSAPFLFEGELLGSFVSGGVLMRKPDSSFLKEIQKVDKTFQIADSRLEEVLKKVKIVSEKKVKAAADILYIMANYLAKTELIDIRLRQERYIQQAKISEEIQDIKHIRLLIIGSLHLRFSFFKRMLSIDTY